MILFLLSLAVSLATRSYQLADLLSTFAKVKRELVLLLLLLSLLLLLHLSLTCFVLYWLLVLFLLSCFASGCLLLNVYRL